MNRRTATVFFVVALMVVFAGPVTVEELRVGRFSGLEPGDVPGDWSTWRFPKVSDETQYSLSEEDGRVVVRADSRTSASALLKEISVDPAVYPNLHWSWKTEDSCFAGHWGEPEIDDFPLRLFVLFEGSGGFFSFFKRIGSSFSGDALVYVTGPSGSQDLWDAQGDRASHLSDRIRVVPLRWTVPTDGEWRRPSRNVRDDYIDLFGKEPNAVSAVAIMSDTDNSETECVSYFGDIYFSDGEG